MAGAPFPGEEDKPPIDVHGSQGVVVGDHATQHNYFFTSRVPLVWPRKVGIVPSLAAGFQHREVAANLTAITGPGRTTILCQILHGLGGIGKTQLAAHYANTIWTAGDIELLVWITATSRDSIISGYAEASVDVVGVEERVEHAARRFLAWLSSTKRKWLVVLDDLTDPADLQGLWPPVATAGRTMVTTRRRDAALKGEGRQLIEVGLFTPAEARAYMRTKLAERPELQPGIDELAKDLGYLPLALAQATAFLLDRDLTCATYRERFADKRRRLEDLLPEPGGLPDDHRATVAATWSLSIDLADSLRPKGLARPILELASYLNPNGIPQEVFTTRAAMAYTESVKGRGADISPDITAENARDAIRCLHRLSLATLTADDWSSSLRVHALVQRATRDHLPSDRRDQAQRAAIEASWQVNGRDMEVVVNVDLVDLALGTVRSITMTTPDRCDTCGGSIPNAFDCIACNSTGRVTTTKTFNVRIPAGTADGMRIRLRETGNWA